MSGGDNIFTLLSALAWPLGLLGGAYIFRDQIKRLLFAATQWFRGVTEVKIGGVELKGIRVEPGDKNFAQTRDIERVAATRSESDERDAIYANSRNLMLVHRVRPSDKPDQTFDISVFLVRKETNRATVARFNEVSHVDYDLGRFFGAGEYGSKYVVRDPANGYAMQTSAYGSPLCIARVHFHDGHVATLSRYLDFEMGTTDGSGNAKVRPEARPRGTNSE
jgi:hypothetical protein